jgi:hypothetical protein
MSIHEQIESYMRHKALSMENLPACDGFPLPEANNYNYKFINPLKLSEHIHSDNNQAIAPPPFCRTG